MILDRFLNDFGGHDRMILLLLFILFQYSFQIMRSLCQEKCEADVNGNAKPMSKGMRRRCHNNAKPMSRRMRSRCQK